MKNLRYYEGKYYQGNLSDTNAGQILATVDTMTSVPILTHIIKDLPLHQIEDIKDSGDKYFTEHGTMSGFDIDYSADAPVGTLRDMQTIGVAFMYFAESALLGDEVGLGKTVQVAGLCNFLKQSYKARGEEFRYCFLTEKTNVGQIRNKMIQFTGEYVGELLNGEQAIVAKYLADNVEHKHYSIVGAHSLLTSPEFLVFAGSKPFDLIIIDESSILKNTTSDIYKNAKSLLRYYKRIILLNATPIENEVREFYNQLDLLDKDYMPTVSDFHKQFCKMEKGFYGFHVGGHKNADKFKEAIKLKYLARTRKGEGATYKDNKAKQIIVPMSPIQRDLSKKTTLYQLVTDYPTGVNRNVDFNPNTTPKLAALLALIDKLDILNDKAIIYCRFKDCQREMVKVLEDKGYKCVILNGDTRAKLRTQIITDFNNGVYSILVTNVQRGIDLETCNNCIMYTIDPNPQKMVQVEGRMTREFDVMYKSTYLIVSQGREKKFVDEKLKSRIGQSIDFSTTGKSMVTDIIQSDNDDDKEIFGENKV